MKKTWLILLCCCFLFLSTAAAEENTWFCSACSLDQSGNFCVYCGAKRANACKACGWEITVEDANFCGNCGQRLTPEKELAIGQVVTFGSYEQDGNTENGKEAIQWAIMNLKDDQALLFSVDILDAQPYHAQGIDSGWENSTIRPWLFTANEINHIGLTRTGNHTEDYIYLLPYAETVDLHTLGLGSIFIPENHEGTPVYLNTGIENFEFANATAHILAKNREAEGYYWEQSGSLKNNNVVGDGCFYHLDLQDAYGVRPACWVSVSALR